MPNRKDEKLFPHEKGKKGGFKLEDFGGVFALNHDCRSGKDYQGIIPEFMALNKVGYEGGWNPDDVINPLTGQPYGDMTHQEPSRSIEEYSTEELYGEDGEDVDSEQPEECAVELLTDSSLASRQPGKEEEKDKDCSEYDNKFLQFSEKDSPPPFAGKISPQYSAGIKNTPKKVIRRARADGKRNDKKLRPLRQPPPFRSF